MIYEYAVDPELAAKWGNQPQHSVFIDKFGIDSGRVVVPFPDEEDWLDFILTEYDRNNPNANGSDKMELYEYLIENILLVPIRIRKLKWDDQIDWLENAEQEHKKLPFYGILTQRNPRNNDVIILEQEILNKKAEKFITKPSRRPKRIANDMFQCIWPMLRCARKILFVDPNFDIKLKRFRELPEKCKEYFELYDIHPKLEIHIPMKREKAQNIDLVVKEFEKRISAIKTNKQELKVQLWRAKKAGERPHDRFILTDIGGVSLSYGLDVDEKWNTTNSGSRCVITRLSKIDHFDIWNEFVGPSYAFEEIGSKVF